MNLDMKSPMPLHAQLKEIIQSEISSGEFRGQIPSERELMDRFRISRTTVREAISSLVREGILEKKHGKGTFINVRPVREMWNGNLKSFTQVVETAGMRAGARLLASGMKTEPLYIANKFDDHQFFMVERLRYANDQVMAIERKCFSVDLGDKLKNFVLDQANIYDILESSLGLILFEAEENITSKIVSKDDAALLGIPKSSSVLATERSTYDPKGKLIEFVTSTFRADKYTISIRMKRSSPGC